MKKTHTIQKPHFKKIFIRRLMIGLIIAAAVFTAALITATFVYKSYIYDEGQEKAIALANYIETEMTDYENGKSPYPDTDSLIIEANSHLVAEASFDAVENKPYIACRLLDKDKSVIGDSTWLLRLKVAQYDDTGDSWGVYLCHPDVYDKVYAAVERYNKKIEQQYDNDKEYGIFVYEAYLDGKYFYPRLSIRSMSKENFHKNELGEWKEEEAVEFYPRDTSSMQYVEYKDKVTMLYFTAWEDHTDPAVESSLDEYVRDKNYEHEYKNVFVFSYPYYSQGGSVDPQYTLVCAFPYSFVQRFSLLVVICAAAAFIITMLIAFINAKLCYADRKAQYEIFTSRRETTNAMAHDLKAPLTAMSGYCEMLREDIDPQKRQHYLDMISSSAEQMNRIVTDILELAKTESDVKALDIQSVDVREVCTQIVQELDAAFEKKSMKCAVTGGEIQIKADRQLFMQAVTNLMHNALVYSKQGSEVDITIDSRQLRIENVPKSMPNTEPDELMKAFVKGNSFRGENSGSGVGLAVANHDLQRMGFTLTIEMTDDRFAAVCRFK